MKDIVRRLMLSPALLACGLASAQEAPAPPEAPAPVIIRPDPAAPVPLIPGALPGEAATTPPPAPQPPPPKVDIPENRTLTTETRDHGDHTVTVQEVLPVELPPEPAPAPPPAVRPAPSATTLQQIIAARPIRRTFILSGTVYDHRATLVRCQGTTPERAFEVWSNIDFNHLRNIGTLRTPGTGIHAAGETLLLCMGFGDIDTALTASRWSRRGLVYQPPAIPALPADPDSDPAFVIAKGDPTPDELAPLLSIHALYKAEHARLRAATAHVARVNAERREWEKTHPPQPEDIIIKHWNTSGQAPAAQTDTTEGGER